MHSNGFLETAFMNEIPLMIRVPAVAGVPRSINGKEPDSAGRAKVAGNASKWIPSVMRILNVKTKDIRIFNIKIQRLLNNI